MHVHIISKNYATKSPHLNWSKNTHIPIYFDTVNYLLNISSSNKLKVFNLFLSLEFTLVIFEICSS